MSFCIFVIWLASFSFRSVAFFFCNVALPPSSHLYRFFQLRTVPSAIPSWFAISISLSPCLYISKALSALASFAFGKDHHLPFSLYTKKQPTFACCPLYFSVYFSSILLFVSAVLYFSSSSANSRNTSDNSLHSSLVKSCPKQ